MNENCIIVLTGETGSGKSYFLREILPKYPNIQIIRKYTTRKSRADEGAFPDVKGDMSEEFVRGFEYVYENSRNKKLYAFSKSEIDRVLSLGKIPCLDLSNEGVLKELLKDYCKVIILKVLPFFTEDTMKTTFDAQGRDKKEFEERKIALLHPLTDWVYNYQNVREIMNPFFLRNSDSDNSDLMFRRIEFIAYEANIDLGASFATSKNTGMYNYLYNLSKNRPVDEPFNFTNKQK